MRRITKVNIALLAALLCGAALHAADAPATKTKEPVQPWPQLNGPYGNFQTPPLPAGKRISDDVKHFRRVWKSEINDIGLGKWGYAKAGFGLPHPSGVASPIVAEGMVFQAYFKYSGDKRLSTANVRVGKQLSTATPEKATVEADDCLVAMDCKTGKTRWRAAHSHGLCSYAGKRAHWGVAPCYHKGKVFHCGTTWRVWAYEAATGRQLWETVINPAHEAMEEMRHKLLAEENPKAFALPATLLSLVVADGVLIVPRRDPRAYFGHLGLVGIDPSTGKQLWEIAEAVTGHTVTPGIWRHEGRDYLLVHTGGYQPAMRLIDPRKGKVLWKVATAPQYKSLAPSGDMVVTLAKLVKRHAKDKKGVALWGAYRLSLKKPELAWVMPDEPRFQSEWWFDCGPMRMTVHRKGLVYIFNRCSNRKPEMHRIYVVGERTGEIVKVYDMADLKAGWWHNPVMPLLVGARIWYTKDAAHGLKGRVLLALDDKGGIKLAYEDDWRPDVEMTSGYEVPFEWGYHNGRILTRGYDGRLHCWDLTVPAKGR